MLKVIPGLVLAVFMFATAAMAQSKSDVKIKMYFPNEELVKVIDFYSKSSGQKMILDPNVHGKVSILVSDELTLDEAFNQLSSALALNGYAISKQGDTMMIASARNVQRSLVEVSAERPNLKPERMVTWVYTVKNLPADAINRDLRILCSKDGEMSVNMSKNQLIFTDWASNLNRIADLLKEIDKPTEASVVKIIEANKKSKSTDKKNE